MPHASLHMPIKPACYTAVLRQELSHYESSLSQYPMGVQGPVAHLDSHKLRRGYVLPACVPLVRLATSTLSVLSKAHIVRDREISINSSCTFMRHCARNVIM